MTRLEAVRIGKCQGAANAQSERRLAEFLDQVSNWNPRGNTLELIARDGTRAWLTRPVEPNPEIAGRWLIESIADQRLVSERQPAAVTIAFGSIGAHADCNSMGGSFTIPAPGRIAVSGPIVSTAIGCRSEDQARPDGFAFTDDGQLILRTNRGLLTMCRKCSPPPFGN